jgi:alpha-amylase/alpha-mannosidase (GH57 family)
VEDWRDLQCLANLAWIDPSFKERGRLRDLSLKGERYSEEDKREILDAQRNIISKIIPTLKSYMHSGQIEISVSPYFHPIMPLIYDSDSALKSMPGAPMPDRRFQHPEDIDKQVEMAIELYSRLFEKNPSGMWPSEGSVSEDILPILQKHGIRWIATDEEILAESLSIPSRSANDDNLISSGKLYKGYGYKKDRTEISLFFRDHALSDNIGFVYSGWDPEKAARDFVAKLKAIHENIEKKKIIDPIVCVILDGENAWEYYRNDGRDFLKALYANISSQSWLKCTTFSDYLNGNPELGELKRLFPGSWINHNFSIWIGHQEDNKAWDLLSRVRAELVKFQEDNPDFDKEKLKIAWREIYIAEGSDWCWWFGEEHIGPNNDEFDSLYRSHLANVYSVTGREPPKSLFKPVRSSFMLAHMSKPIDYISPTIDGRLTDFYEWNQAGFFDCVKAGSTMHRAENILRGIWFGYDQTYIYLMIKAGITIEPERFQKFSFLIEFQAPQRAILELDRNRAVFNLGGTPVENLQYALDHLLELSIPLSAFDLSKDNDILIRVQVSESGKTLETWPSADSIIIPIPREGSGDIPWVV